MGSASRRAESSLAERLEADGHDFDFFQAVRLMLRMLPHRSPVGQAAKPQNEVVRFHTRLTLEFPASAIHEVRNHVDNGCPPDMTVAFMGLTGSQGVLPFFYTEWMLLRETHKDSAMPAFFDLFHHRWISLFYRAWEKHRLPIAFEREVLGQKSAGQISHYTFDFVGLGTEGLRDRLRVKDSTLVYYAGLIAQRSRSATSLRGLLRDYFHVPFEVLQFQGAWYKLENQDRCYLDIAGIHNQLGVGAVVGDAVWDPQSRFEVRVGPLQYQQFRRFLPNGRAAGELNDLVRIFVGATIGFTIRLILRGDEVPSSRLAEDTNAPRLGWDLWLGKRDPLDDADDAVFEEAA